MPDQIRGLAGRTTRGVLTVLRDEIKRWVLGLPRYGPMEMKRHHKGPGVYLFFNRGEPLRAGSSRMGEIRVTNQLKQLMSVILLREARECGIPLSTSAKCGGCGRTTYTETPEYVAFRESFVVDLSVAFIPMETLIGTGMEVRQFEGLIIWAFSPPLNSKDEIRKLYRRTNDGSIETDLIR